MKNLKTVSQLNEYAKREGLKLNNTGLHYSLTKDGKSFTFFVMTGRDSIKLCEQNN